MLIFDWRKATKDVDAVFEGNRETVRRETCRDDGPAMTPRTFRPATIAEVAARVSRGEQKFNPALRAFLDHFYSHPETRCAAVAQHPASIGDVPDAYLAATAEHLCGIYKIRVPSWVEGHGRPLRKAFFAGGLESQGHTHGGKPLGIPRRLLFVSKNALDRPRRSPEAPELQEPALAYR